MQRALGRSYDELRTVKITRRFTNIPEGSVLIEIGETRVLCTASVEERVPPFLRGSGKGWVTAEYAMIPRATKTRTQRESTKGRLTGRTMEIQRLIGRALRSVVDLKMLGERTIWLDCEVLQADGGTRTAAITGAYIALVDAVRYLMEKELIGTSPILDTLAAVSVGKIQGQAVLDLDYGEDSLADVDMNVVMTGAGKFVEIQGTAEETPFDRADLDMFLQLADKGIRTLMEFQKSAVETNRMKIILATKNLGKIRELQELLVDEGIKVLSLLDVPDWEDVKETGATFAENAAIKAREAARKTGLITLADDSGLEVDALGGAPGIFSARYAGEPKNDERNTDKLLELLETIPPDKRTARFRCALVVVTPDREEYLTEGVVEGQILTERRGADGFGYDPVFYLPEFGKTMAEINLAEKNKISHRAQAFRKVIPILRALNVR